MPRPPRGPVANRGLRIGARAIDSALELVAVIVILLVLGDGDRPFAALAIAWSTIVIIEAAAAATFGATLGKLMVGLRIVGIDDTGRPPWGQATKRAAANAALSTFVLIGWVIWLSSTLTDALGRGISDRAARTMVVPKDATLPIKERDLPGYADGARPPRLSAYGRVGDLDVRVRARLRRLADAPMLVVAIGLLAFVASMPFSTLTMLALSSVIWVIVFVADETWRVSRYGATAGHHMAGLVVLDRKRGGAPRAGRSFARALVLALTLYVPPLWLLLLPPATALMIRFGSEGRGLHDFAGGTVVVADARIDPETQRHLAMRMRVGQAA